MELAEFTHIDIGMCQPMVEIGGSLVTQNLKKPTPLCFQENKWMHVIMSYSLLIG